MADDTQTPTPPPPIDPELLRIGRPEPLGATGISPAEASAAGTRSTTTTADDNRIGHPETLGGGMMNRPIDQLPSNTSRGGTGFWRGLGLGTRATATGVLSLPTMAADALGYPGRAIIRAAGGDVTAPSEWLQKGFDYIGLPRPETEAEKTTSDVVSAGAGMITPMGIANLAAKAPEAAAALGRFGSAVTDIPKIGPTIARAAEYVKPLISSGPVDSVVRAGTQVGAGAGGAALGDYLAGSDQVANYVPDWLRPTVRAAGNLVGAGLVNAATGGVGTLVNMAQGQRTDIAAALDRLRIFPRTAGSVTENPNIEGLEAGATKLPFAQGVLQPKQRDTASQFHSAVEETARELGGEATRQEAGGSVQRILQDWHANTFPEEQAALWNPIRERLGPMPADDAPYRQMLTEMAYPPRLAGLPQTQTASGSAWARDRLDRLTADLRGRNGPMTVDEALALKTQLGQDMGTPKIIEEVGMDRLQSLYGALAEGIKPAAERAGMGQQLAEANAQTVAAHNFIKTTVAKAITAKNPGQETTSADAAANAMANSNEALQALRARVPAAADAMGAWLLRKNIEAVPSKQGADSTASTGSFLTRMRQMQLDRPEGTEALYGADPEVAQRVRDLMTAAAKIREVEKNMNTSQTGSNLAYAQVATAPFRAGGAYMGGGVPAAALSLASDVAPYLTSKALTSPFGIRYAGTPAGPRPPMPASQAGLLGYLGNYGAPPLPSEQRRQ